MEVFIENMKESEIKNKRVLEVGSRYVNGSVRPFIEKWLKPREYTGIDIEAGKYVDILLTAEKLVEYFGSESFDAVICANVIEHVKDWRLVIENMKEVLKKGGYIYITAPSIGFTYHAFPFDFWRYEIKDIRKIFSDFQITVLKNYEPFGIFLKAYKPLDYQPNEIREYALYSVILGKRATSLHDVTDMPITRRLKFIIKELEKKRPHFGLTRLS